MRKFIFALFCFLNEFNRESLIKMSIPDPLSIPLPDDCPPPSPPPLPPELDELPPLPPEPAPEPEAESVPKLAQIPQPESRPTVKRKRHSSPGQSKRQAISETSREEQDMMAKIMGFSDFDSTKGKKVPGNDVGAVHVVKKRRYRQYMNRKGGFNRPLDKVA